MNYFEAVYTLTLVFQGCSWTGYAWFLEVHLLSSPCWKNIGVDIESGLVFLGLCRSLFLVFIYSGGTCHFISGGPRTLPWVNLRNPIFIRSILSFRSFSVLPISARYFEGFRTFEASRSMGRPRHHYFAVSAI